MSFKSPSPKPHLNRTGSVFAHSIFDLKKSLLSHLSGQKGTFGITSWVALGSDFKFFGVSGVLGGQHLLKMRRFLVKDCDCSEQLQGVVLRAQNAKKRLKKVVSGLSARSAKKVSKKCRRSAEEVPKRDFLETFPTFRHLFGTPGRQARDDLFETIFWHVGPGGPGTPYIGKSRKRARNLFFEGVVLLWRDPRDPDPALVDRRLMIWRQSLIASALVAQKPMAAAIRRPIVTQA